MKFYINNVERIYFKFAKNVTDHLQVGTEISVSPVCSAEHHAWKMLISLLLTRRQQPNQFGNYLF